MGEQVSMLQDEASFGYMPECGRTESCGRSISIVLKNSHTDFRSGSTSLHSPQQWMSILLTHILASVTCHLFY